MTDSLLLHPTVVEALAFSMCVMDRDIWLWEADDYREAWRRLARKHLAAIAEPLAALLEERAKDWQHYGKDIERLNEMAGWEWAHEQIARLLRGEGTP